jgi:hypothetical protein
MSERNGEKARYRRERLRKLLRRRSTQELQKGATRAGKTDPGDFGQAW